ncbi:hypothetical protein [Methanobrevibacter sp.]|uniref:hypothetical protein n=1 Tax=Methanobrevibacter sp. TaxID=66852 RepID=UPI0038667BC5
MATPVRLYPKKTIGEKIDDFALTYAHIIMPVALILLMVLFVCLCYAIVGVSATESGVQYNHFQDVI